MFWRCIYSSLSFFQKIVSQNRLRVAAMAKEVSNAQTICGSRIGFDTEDDIMIVVTQRCWSPAVDNEETVCWFESFVQPDEVSYELP